MSWPAAGAYGPSWPHPVMRPNTSFGLRARQTSGPTPSRSITPGRKPSISASARGDEVEQHADPVGVLEVDRDVAPVAPQEVDVRRCRAPGRRTAPARSTRITSAPMSASIIAANGAGPDAGQLDDLEAVRVQSCARAHGRVRRRAACASGPRTPAGESVPRWSMPSSFSSCEATSSVAAPPLAWIRAVSAWRRPGSGSGPAPGRAP